ncbi:hypothetical protein [Actinophytocola xanthii]|uniref:Uncharacterized protein n=1 Tax=Actinophytocola xanthii TaxID=1912961 RepID=A0A1Q8CDW6_9PSEU|nr:hypothetical protein [Actinophytocola xanthii]OLF12565.1 hypothetical protein BU204_29070 [Actinophytocola xanthii]
MVWVWVWIAVVVAVAVVLFRKDPLTPGKLHTGPQELTHSDDEAIAARSRYYQLGHYVEDSVVTPEQVEDEDAAALLRTARERWLSTGAILAKAVTEGEFAQAERVAVQGLRAVANAYERLGRTGPTVPD